MSVGEGGILVLIINELADRCCLVKPGTCSLGK